MRLLSAVVVSLLFAASTEAATYYVATNGSDTASGSIDAPFATITKAAQIARPGDVVNVRGGVYGDRVSIGSKGTAAAPIVFRSMPGETAVLDGTSHASNQAVVTLTGTEHVDFSGFEIRNSPYIGVVLWFARNTRILDNHIHHTTRNGIYAGGDVMPACFDITVSGNSVHDTVLENQHHTMSGGGWAGAIVVSRTDRATITNNRVWNNDGEGIISLRSNHALIRNNEIYDNFSVYLYLDNARYVTVDRNLIYSTGNTRYYRDGRPGAGIGIANETKDMGNPSRDNVITNNIVIGTRWGFYYGNYESGGGLHSTHVANNTFYATTDEIIRIESNLHSNTTVQNNIFHQVGTPAPRYGGGGAVTYAKNVWYGGTGGAAAGASDLYGDAGFANPGGRAAADYRIAPASIAAKSGAAIPAVTTDYWGTPRALSFDIGAHQVTADVVPPPLDPTTPTADTDAPATPSGFWAVASSSSTRMYLGWDASTDNVGVAGYRIYRNGSLVATISGTAWTDDSGLKRRTTYTWAVEAFDAAGNVSGRATESARTSR